MSNITSINKEPEKILMPNQDKALLKELYLLRSYSGFEEPVRRGIIAYLTKLNIPFVNYNGNIVGLNYPGAPLFSAHMDMVNTEGYILKSSEFSVEGGVFTVDEKTNIRLYRDKEKKHQTSLGADDKNGIWVILTLLKNGHKINFVFCHSEETGGTGSRQVVTNDDFAKFISECQYGIIIDRKNKGDIIGYNNQYCLTLDDRLEAFSKEKDFGYSTATGSISDADRFADLLECVNLSCGYYEPHTSREHTNLNELWNTYLFCETILKDFNFKSASSKRMRQFRNKSTYASSTTTKYGGTSTGYYASASYYGSKKIEEDDDYDYCGGYSSYTSAAVTKKKDDEKKTSDQKTSSKTLEKDSDSLIITDDDDLFDATLAGEFLEEALESGAAYCEPLGLHIIPLYDTEDLHDIPPASILTTQECPHCGRPVSICQESVDELYLSYYDTRRGTPEKVLGICTACLKSLDVTNDLSYFI